MIISLLIIAGVITSIAAASTPDDFVRQFLEPGEFSYSRQVEYAGYYYYIVWVNATPTFVLKQYGDSYVFVNDTSMIHAILLRDFLNTVDISSEIATLNNSLVAFQSQRYPLQHDCEVSTGTDHLPCYDEDSCLQACLSVPSCRNYNQPSGGALVREILAWRQHNEMLDKNISLYQGNLSLAVQKNEQIDIAVSSMDALLAKFYPPINYIMNQNKLFKECPDCFFYCNPINFNTSYLAASNQTIQQLRAKLTPMASFAAVADEVRRQTILRTEKNRFALLMMRMESITQNLTHQATPILARIRDDAVSFNLTRIQAIYSQAVAYGENKNYEPAFALEPEFNSIAGPLENRLKELQGILDRYDAMMARVSSDLFNATANANNALQKINDTALNESLEKMRNISDRMVELANQSDYFSAFELEDDYFWESKKVNEMIVNITIEYASITGLDVNVASLLNATGAKLRQDDVELREKHQNLSARFQTLRAAMNPPLNPSDVPQFKANLQSLYAEASSLSQLIDRMHRIRDRQLTYNQTKNLLIRLFFAWPKAW